MDAINIINSINTIAEKLFKSVEGEVFKKLDELLILDENILLKEPLNTLYIKADEKGFVLLISSFIIFFCIYYLIERIIAMYNGENAENIYRYILRIIICVICSTSSIYICEQILSLNGILTQTIASIGKDLTGQTICFESLREIVIDIDKYMSTDAISIDGVIKGVISFGATSILIYFSVRYVTIIFLIMFAPIAIMLASSSATYGIFKSWIKMLVTNIFVQNIVCIILMIPIAMKDVDDNMFKIVLVGSIYLLYKIGNFTKDFLGNISEKITRRG